MDSNWCVTCHVGVRQAMLRMSYGHCCTYQTRSSLGEHTAHVWMLSLCNVESCEVRICTCARSVAWQVERSHCGWFSTTDRRPVLAAYLCYIARWPVAEKAGGVAVRRHSRQQANHDVPLVVAAVVQVTHRELDLMSEMCRYGDTVVVWGEWTLAARKAAGCTL